MPIVCGACYHAITSVTMTPFRMKTASASTSTMVYLAVALNEDLANELEGREKEEFQPKNHDMVPELFTLKQGDVQLYDGDSKCWQPTLMPQILRASGAISRSPSMLQTRNLKQVVGQKREKQSLPPAAMGEEKRRSLTITRTIEGSQTETIERTYLPKPGSEDKMMANWLNAIITSLRSLDQGSSTSSHSLLDGPLIGAWLRSARAQRRWSAECSMKPISGTDLVLKPDVALLTPDPDDISNQFSWRNVVSVLELTSEKISSRLCPQIARNAYGASAQPGHRFVIILSIANQLPRLHLFDRAGGVHSRGYDIRLHPNLLVRVLNTLTLGCLEHPCFSPAISRMNIQYRRPRLTIKAAKKTNDITPVLFNSEIIRGRATVSFLVEDTDRNVGKRYVVKDSWTCTGRATTEEEMLERMKERKLTNGVTTLEAARTFRIEEEDDSTNLRRPSCLFSDDDFLPEIRVHRRLFLAPVGSLTEFSCIQELLSVLIDIIEIHKTLLDCGILHRDIGISNILMFAGGPWEIREKDTEKLKRLSEREDIIRERGFRRGLINFDCARFINGSSTGTSQGERTGTIPFMAIDILYGYAAQDEATVHEPRHDLESIIYVLIWICVIYRHPRDPQRQPRPIESTCLKTWVITGRKYYYKQDYKQDFQVFGSVKADETSTQTPVKEFTGYFEDIKKPIRLLYEAIGRSRMPDGPPLTHDSVKMILLDAFFDQQPDPLSDIKLWAELPSL